MKRNYFILLISIVIQLLYMSLSVVYSAELTVEESNNFSSYATLNPSRSTDPLVVLSIDWKDIEFFTLQEDGSQLIISSTPKSKTVSFIEQPLVFPNPLQIAKGDAVLGYGLKNSALEPVTLHIFDMFGYEILTKTFKNEKGAFSGYNRIQLDAAFFENKALSTGVYFLIFLHNNALIGKTKMVVTQ